MPTHTLTRNLHNHQRVREAVCELCCMWLIVRSPQNGFGNDLTCATPMQTPRPTAWKTVLELLYEVGCRGTRGAADCPKGRQGYITPGRPTSPWKANTWQTHLSLDKFTKCLGKKKEYFLPLLLLPSSGVATASQTYTESWFLCWMTFLTQSPTCHSPLGGAASCHAGHPGSSYVCVWVRRVGGGTCPLAMALIQGSNWCKRMQVWVPFTFPTHI